MPPSRRLAPAEHARIAPSQRLTLCKQLAAVTSLSMHSSSDCTSSSYPMRQQTKACGSTAAATAHCRHIRCVSRHRPAAALQHAKHADALHRWRQFSRNHISRGIQARAAAQAAQADRTRDQQILALTSTAHASASCCRRSFEASRQQRIIDRAPTDMLPSNRGSEQVGRGSRRAAATRLLRVSWHNHGHDGRAALHLYHGLLQADQSF